MSKRTQKTTITTTKKQTKMSSKNDDFDPSQYASDFLSEHEIEDMKTAFDILDRSSNGSVSVVELKNLLKNLPIVQNDSGLEKILGSLEGKQDTLAFDDFIEVLSTDPSKVITRQYCDEVFELITNGKADTIGVNDLKKVGDMLCQPIDDSEAQAMIRTADLDGDGKVSFDEFYGILTRKL